MELGGLELFFVLMAASAVIGVIAVLGGVGGGVMFTPLMMGFTPIDSLIIRATGLLAAMAGSLVAARLFLRRGLANMRLLILAAIPYSGFAVIGACLAGYVRTSAGDTGEAGIRLALGILVIGIAVLMVSNGRKTEYPEAMDIDQCAERLRLGTSYYEQSLHKVIHYRVARVPVGILLFCFAGLISGLFGLGAGWAMVPALNLVMLVPLKAAAASSTVLIGIGDTAAVWPYMMEGNIFPLFAVPCVLGLVIGAIVGSRIMLRMRARYVRWIVVLLMFGAGVKLLVDGVGRLI